MPSVVANARKERDSKGPFSGLASPVVDNESIALRLIKYADRLSMQGADGFRERAYRRAAETVRRLSEPIADIFARSGIAGLVALPTIGKSIGGAIAEILITDSWSQLDRIENDYSPTLLFKTIPGIGEKLAERLVHDYHIETMQELEVAVHDDAHRLKGFGPGRREAIKAVLAQRLHTHSGGGPAFKALQPSVALLLEVDDLYRHRAAEGKLHKIRPRLHNPANRTWLPVMHYRQDNWHFTAMYSNTARAHQLQKTMDWVVIYYQADDQHEGRCTVVTETKGEMKGFRVVRGRESETN